MSTLSPVRPPFAPGVVAIPAQAAEADALDAGGSFDDLLTAIRARRREFTAQQHISPDIVAGFKRHGVYRMLVPRRLGGEERSPREFCELIEKIAQADGSAGWVASFGMGITYLAGLPLATLREIYAHGPDVVFAGGIFPPQPASAVEGGYEVSGRWSFASGCMGADVVGVGIVTPRSDGAASALPRMAVMPRARATVVPNWNVIGMSGTGSHDLLVDRVVVPEAWTFVRGAASTLDEPMFRYPSLSFATQVLSVVGLGIARAAIEELRAMASGRVSITGAPVLADRPQVQMEVAKCEAELRAARAFFYEAMDDAWATLVAGDRAADAQISLLRLSSTHATRVSARVTRGIQMLTGMTGIQESCPISTQVRDSLVLTQHAFMGDITYQNAGALLFGRKPLPGYL